MRNQQVADAGRAAGTLLADGVQVVHDLHRTIARRAFTAAGPAARPAHIVHDRVAAAAYGAVAQVARTVPHGAATVMAHVTREAPPLDRTRHGNVILGAVNGIAGDRLAGERSALGYGMTIRHHGQDIALTAEAIGASFPRATSRIALFVHGLCETEEAWHPTPTRQTRTGAVDFGAQLSAETGHTPVHLRYNSGLHVSSNGDALDRLLDALVAVWPVAVDDIALVGHSMGGLVARSALHQGQARDAGWVALVGHVFFLGTPHSGASLERGVNALSWAMSRLPETRSLARVLNRRSAGIKDLRYGSLLQADWEGLDPDELLTDRCQPVPLLNHVRHYFIGVTITRDHRHPLGRLVGDLLVQFDSASGKGGYHQRHIPFAIDQGHHIGGLHHFDLLSHPAVGAQLVHWLGEHQD